MMTDDDAGDDDGGFWRKILLMLYRSCFFLFQHYAFAGGDKQKYSILRNRAANYSVKLVSVLCKLLFLKYFKYKI